MTQPAMPDEIERVAFWKRAHSYYGRFYGLPLLRKERDRRAALTNTLTGDGE
jgi:hypothetical protein